MSLKKTLCGRKTENTVHQYLSESETSVDLLVAIHSKEQLNRYIIANQLNISACSVDAVKF